MCGLYAICICCCWNNIMLGAAVMQAASDFVSTNKKLLFTPIVAYIMSFIFFALWLVFAAYLYSMGPV